MAWGSSHLKSAETNKQLPERHLKNQKEIVSWMPREADSLVKSESVQFSHSVVSHCLRPHGPQHCQASLSITNSRSLLKLTSIESVMPSNHLILGHPLLLPSIFPSIKVFPNESVLLIRWPKYWSFTSASVLPMNIQD